MVALGASQLGPFVDHALNRAELLAGSEVLACRPTVVIELALGVKDHAGPPVTLPRTITP